MKSSLFIILIICSLGYNAAAQSGVKVLAPIVPNGSADTYPTHYDIFGQGGYMSFATIADRDLLPDQRKKAGMLIYVVEKDAFFQWDGVAANWKQVNFGTSNSGIVWQGQSLTPPNAPLMNWAYYNTKDQASYIFDGTVWQPFATGVPGKDGISISWQGTLPSAPTSPQVNWAYYDATLKQSLIFDGTTWQPLANDGLPGKDGAPGKDGTSIVWQGTLTSAPVNAQVNWAYYDATLKQSLIFDGTSWQPLANDGLPGKDGAPGKDGTSIVWQGTLTSAPTGAQVNWAYYDATLKQSRIFDGTTWQTLAQDGSGGGSTGPFNGSRAITSPVNGLNGLNPNTNDIAKWIEAVFYPSQGPTASLTLTYNGTTSGNFVVEQMGAGTSKVDLNWTAGKQASTDVIKTITVNGSNPTFTDPAQGASVSGKISGVSITNNTDKTFRIDVTTNDNKTASATASISFQWKRYWGFVNTGTGDKVTYVPTSADLIALPNNEFGTSKNFSKAVSAPASAQKFFIAFPAAWDVGTQIMVGGLDATTSFDKQTIVFTNASGGSTNYVVYITRNNTAGSVSFIVQ